MVAVRRRQSRRARAREEVTVLSITVRCEESETKKWRGCLDGYACVNLLRMGVSVCVRDREGNHEN